MDAEPVGRLGEVTLAVGECPLDEPALELPAPVLEPDSAVDPLIDQPHQQVAHG